MSGNIELHLPAEIWGPGGVMPERVTVVCSPSTLSSGEISLVLQIPVGGHSLQIRLSEESTDALRRMIAP